MNKRISLVLAMMMLALCVFAAVPAMAEKTVVTY